MSPTKIYLAGKATGPTSRWRTNPSGGRCLDSVSEEIYASAAPIRINEKLVYTGPFTVSCDHACGHQCPHATGPCSLASVPTKLVADRCKQQVASSDVVLARLDQSGLTGTIAEVGIAVQAGKEIVLDIAPGMARECWFLVELCRNSVTPRALRVCKRWLSFAPSTKREYDEYLVRGGMILHPEDGVYVDEIGFDRYGNYHHMG